MRVCVVGSGGREHALAHVLSRTAEVVVTPGNPGTSSARAGGRTGDPAGVRVTSTPVGAEEIDADLYVIGPETPLVEGIADRLRARGCRVFGPGADGAMLEGSKAWMKALLTEAGIPTARHGVFTDEASAERWLRAAPGPYVVKTDGLAGGKGVLVTPSLEEALADARAKLAGSAFGEAGRRVVLEEAMSGPELSLLVICDGKAVLPLAPAQDFKRLRDGETGPNTGGMGAYSPVPVASSQVVDEVMDRAIEPLVAALRKRAIDYRGVLYAGLMLTATGPKVVEFNVRFGDPEAQAVLPRLDGDLAELLASAADGHLRGRATFVPDACVCVVMAAAGYPGSARSGDIISGVEDAEKVEGVTVFHAGTALAADGSLVTSGGRVLDVTAMGATLASARERAYEAAGRIRWRGIHHRGDIALEATSAGAGS